MARQRRSATVRLRPRPRWEAATVECQDARGKVRLSRVRQHQKARVVRDQLQPAPLHTLRPSDPGVAGLALERRCAPREQGEPALAVRRDVPKHLADERGVVKVVLLDQQPVERLALVRCNRTYEHSAKIDRPSDHASRSKRPTSATSENSGDSGCYSTCSCWDSALGRDGIDAGAFRQWRGLAPC